MASRADRWKYLHSLVLDPENVWVAKAGGRLWMTDRYVMVDLDVAEAWVRPDEGHWKLRASQGPVEAKWNGPEPNLSGQMEAGLPEHEALNWLAAQSTPWAVVGLHSTTRMLVTADADPVLMNDTIVTSWSFAPPDCPKPRWWQVARTPRGCWMARARLADRTFGYLMGVRDQVVPEFPKLVA